MNQLKRMEVYDQFCRKSHSILLSTDLASRGLDFPNINWVVQADCPIDVNTYIHRVGRTARYEKNGQALLILTHSEANVFLEQLEGKKIQLENLKVNKKYLVNIEAKLQGLCAGNVELKESVNKT
jgi:ATP-dependent RNA helicase DDX10/DBP4